MGTWLIFKKYVKEITDAAALSEKIILATDPDREGEAIAWHVREILESKKLQNDSINELRKVMPKYILYDSELFNFNFFKKLNVVNEFINSNYEFHEKYMHWTFFKLKT